ncbi:MAG: aminoacyl-tRNA hydrolase, partial [Candidatus Dormibacteraeota bacterium]|nr:aminoacyl-tRNA hydrolase [Candidatus Dormibacteraeota bacterium]
MSQQPIATVSDLIVVGLGNPGSEYAGTRHNIGWACLDELGARLGVEVRRRRWRSLVGRATVAGVDGPLVVWLVKPQTFMNESGRAVHAACRDVGVGPRSVWVVHDEMDLPLCRLRIRDGGSSAGHNGIRSIAGALGTDAFLRFRVGVGRQPGRGSESGRRHVLGRFSKR